MRLAVALGCLLMVGCSGPHSTGALWAQQNLERELVMFRLGDQGRTAQAHAYELGLADDTLAAERARIGVGLQDCPGDTRQPLALSVGDRLRDSVRIRARADPTRLTTVAQLALADWYLRRARATADSSLCDQARQVLRGPVNSPTSSDVLAGLGTATVTRDPQHPVVADAVWTVDVALSSYALGYVDTVQAAAPLPQYLAAVYGGMLLEASDMPPLNGDTPEAFVDRLAPAHPEWEPDALYAALGSR